jgi:hypothetical protein
MTDNERARLAAHLAVELPGVDGTPVEHRRATFLTALERFDDATIDVDDMANNTLATGALMAALAVSPADVTPYHVQRNELFVRMGFLRSPYRLTVERIDDDS